MSLTWKKLGQKKISINRFRKLWEKRFRLPNGYVGKFYTRAGADIVCALVMTKDQRIVLAKQFRPGPEVIMWELPGGARDHDSPRRAIQREVLEETGYRGRLHLVARTTNDGWADFYRYHFVVTDAVSVQAPAPERTEAVEVAVVSLTKFKQLLAAGKLTDAETAYRGLSYLGKL